EKRSLPQASYAFSGYDLRLHLHGGQAVSRTDKCHQSMRAPVPTGTVSLVAALPTPVRNDGVGRYSAPVRDVAYVAIPNMVPVYEAQRSHRQASQSSGVLQMQESPGDLENPLVSRRVGHYGHRAVHIPGHRAVHIPGHLNYGADLLSRADPRAADWCLHPQVIGQIWVRFFKAQVDLFANRQNTCCPLWFSRSPGRSG